MRVPAVQVNNLLKFSMLVTFGVCLESVFVTWLFALDLCAVQVGGLPWISALVRFKVCLRCLHFSGWISTCGHCAGHVRGRLGISMSGVCLMFSPILTEARNGLRLGPQ